MFTLKTFYKSKEWKELISLLKIQRTSNDGVVYCEHCGEPIYQKYDCIAHHVIELNDKNVNNTSISLNPENIKLIHHHCHNQIHTRFGYASQRRVYLVYGSPCSGKSTWVHDNANKDDLIIDIDNIWQMITVNDRYIKPNGLKMNVFGVRDCLLDMIKTRTGKWHNAYIVGGYPLAMERQRLCERMNAEPIYIDSTYDECINRLVKSNDRDYEVWSGYIKEWFDRYQPDD